MKQEEQEKKQDVQLKLKKYNVEVMSVSKDLLIEMPLLNYIIK